MRNAQRFLAKYNLDKAKLLAKAKGDGDKEVDLAAQGGMSVVQVKPEGNKPSKLSKSQWMMSLGHALCDREFFGPSSLVSSRPPVLYLRSRHS